MSLTAIDHALAFVLLVVAPLLGRRNFEHFKKAIARGGPDARRRQYRKEIRRQWLVAAGVLALWLALGRSLRALGLALPLDLRSAAGLAFTTVLLGLLWRQRSRVVGMTPERLAANFGQVESVAEILPRTDREAAAFRLLAVTAGVCEEIVYRGYLIAYAAVFLPVWWAAVIAGIAFGLAHAYQGAAGVLKTGVTGVVAGLLYVATGSLLWPILAHAAIDLHGGAVGRRILEAAPGTAG